MSLVIRVLTPIKSYVVRTEYTYQDDGNSIWVWEDTLSSIIGFILILDLRYMILRMFSSISGRALKGIGLCRGKDRYV